MPGYNKVISVEDFADPAIKAIIRDVFAHELEMFSRDYPEGVADSRQWEIAMAVRALRDHGCLNRQSRLLGVGAGTEMASFYLTRHAGEVVATDRYANTHARADVAPLAFLTSPRSFSPVSFEENRLIPLHMDPRVLRFPDNSFDGIYSCGSIGCLGSLDAVANAAYEIGRVLRPGGVAAISALFEVAGPHEPGPDILLFSRSTLINYIVDASGLEPVDALDLDASEATLSQRRDPGAFVHGTAPANTIAQYPALILHLEGALFCSVHLTLRKPDNYPVRDNSWAAPGPDTAEQVHRHDDTAVSQLGGTLLAELQRLEGDRQIRERLTAQSARLQELQDFVNAQENHLRALESLLESSRNRIGELEDQAQAYRTALDQQGQLLEAERASSHQHAEVIAALNRGLADRQNAIEQIKNSLSWRLTAPIRALLAPFVRGK